MNINSHRCPDYTARVSQSMFDLVNRNHIGTAATVRKLGNNPEAVRVSLNPVCIAHVNERESNNPLGFSGVVRGDFNGY